MIRYFLLFFYVLSVFGHLSRLHDVCYDFFKMHQIKRGSFNVVEGTTLLLIDPLPSFHGSYFHLVEHLLGVWF